MSFFKKISRRRIERKVKGVVRELRNMGNIDFDDLVDGLERIDLGELQDIYERLQQAVMELLKRKGIIGGGNV